MAAGSRVTRTVWTDHLVEGEESAVFVGGQVIVLSALATTLLGGVGADGAGVDALGERLVAAYGVPPGGDARAATEGVVAELVERGVLQVDGAGAG